MSWAPRKPMVDQAEDPIFRPETYGTVDGGDASIDMPLVQAAIDAAGAAGGGTVVLEATYAMLEQDSIQCGVYTNTYYGIWCNYDNVIIDGKATGTLLLEAMPAHTRYAMLLVGCGGYQAGGWPGLSWLLANGDIPRGVKVRDLSFDASILTVPNMASLAADVFSANLGFAFCQDFEVDGVTVDKGFGNNGAIGCVATCRDFVIKNCTVDAAYENGFFADGAKDAEYDNCVVSADVDAAVLSHGISIGTSSDYYSYSENVNIHDCTIIGTWDGIATGGRGARVVDCEVTIKDINSSRIGIQIGVGYAGARDCDSDGVATVTGNTVQRPIGATYEKGYGVYLVGVNVGYKGSPLKVHDCEIHSNHIKRVDFGLVLGPQACENKFTYNTIEDCDAVYADASGGTAIGNVIADNTVI